MVNFLVAYFLLQAAGLLSSQHAAFSRMVCASGIASLSALILFAPELSYPAQILYKILTACAVVGVAFGLQGLRRFVTAVCWYAALNILLAGLCIAVILRTGTPLLQAANLTVYLRISPVVLLLLSAASCGAVWLVLHFSGSTPQTTRTIGIEFELCGAPVRLLRLVPGMRADIIPLLEGRYRALVLESFGVGGLPGGDDGAMFAAVRDWCGAGHLAVFTTQVPHEGSDLAVYEVGRAAKALPGVLEAHDMTPEATAVKLMWVLGQTTDRAEAEKLFLTPVQWDIL